MRKLAACLLLILNPLLISAAADGVAAIREMRLQGDLWNARTLATEQLQNAAPVTAFALHLELARINDRIGLHTYTRPVAAALQHVEHAAALAQDLDEAARAQVQLAYAEYYYRAEMSEREFPTATEHANAALASFEALHDQHGQADAVHRQGLIALQRRQLDLARELFDESLHLDIAGGERVLFRGEYGRHVGFIYFLRDEFAAALPHFERSLKARIDGGAKDASMFAAITLANTLVELGQVEDALPHLDYAMQVAKEIPSHAGRSRIEAVRANINEKALR